MSLEMKIITLYQKFGMTGLVLHIWKHRRYLKKNLSRLGDKGILNSVQYRKWRKNNEKYNLVQVGRIIQSFAQSPKVSIIVSVYNTEAKYLDACIQSVLDQYYDNWELCLYDNASTNEGTLNCLKHWEGRDPRIRVKYGEVNGHASDQAVALATGKWYAFLDPNDTITSWALYEVIKSLQKNPEVKYVYTDEDRLSPQGLRYGSFFKPNFDIDYLTSSNYICRFRWCRADIYTQVGGERVGFEGSQDHDLALRVASIVVPSEFLHVSIIGYNWRMIPGSTAHDTRTKSYTIASGVRAVQEHFDRKGELASALATEVPGIYRVSRVIIGQPLVSIIIPFRDQAATTQVCVESILAKSTYTNYEVLLVDNQSTEQGTAELLQRYSSNPRIQIMKYDAPFNYSAINNYAAGEARGEYLILLNNDTEVITPNWIEELLQQAQRPEVGAVGARLLYPDNTLQHAGVIVGLGGYAGHVYHGRHSGYGGYHGALSCIRRYSAVTAACLMVARSKFQQVHGLDEINLSVAYNDVDFCLRLGDVGYATLFTPYATLYHHESKSRGSDADDLTMLVDNTAKYIRIWKERVYFLERWQSVILSGDPSYNKNLSRYSSYKINI